MAGLCGLALRVSWISCLLISSITCFPASKGFGSYNPGSTSSGFGGWPSTSGAGASGSFSGGYGSNVGSGYGNTGHGNVGYGSAGAGLYDGGSVESHGSGVDDFSGPVFTDLSDLDPVYSFRSHSGYQQGRATFSQTRYTPGEVQVPPIQILQTSPIYHVKAPAKAPPKGHY